jgi:formate-dependent nitrite reductase cytochrome c552 subunit
MNCRSPLLNINHAGQTCHNLDLIEAENSMGFHAPQEAARIPGESIDFTRRGQEELRR